MFRAVILALVVGTIQTMMPEIEPSRSSDQMLVSIASDVYVYEYLESNDG